MPPALLDILIAAVIAIGAIWGFVRGAIRIAGPFVLAAGFVVMKEAYPELVTAFREQPKLPTMAIVKVAIFAGFMAYGLLARFIHRAVDASGLGIFNRLAGVFLGSATATILAGFALWMARSFAGESIDPVLLETGLTGVVLQVFALLTLIAEQLFQA